MLQGLEEELNRQKPHREKMDSNVRPTYYDGQDADMSMVLEEVYDASTEWWSDYLYNNDCFISDVLYGEVCNEIQCVNCKKASTLLSF